MHLIGCFMLGYIVCFVHSRYSANKKGREDIEIQWQRLLEFPENEDNK